MSPNQNILKIIHELKKEAKALVDDIQHFHNMIRHNNDKLYQIKTCGSFGAKAKIEKLQARNRTFEHELFTNIETLNTVKKELKKITMNI
jgi:hypothetical protein